MWGLRIRNGKGGEERVRGKDEVRGVGVGVVRELGWGDKAYFSRGFDWERD